MQGTLGKKTTNNLQLNWNSGLVFLHNQNIVWPTRLQNALSCAVPWTAILAKRCNNILLLAASSIAVCSWKAMITWRSLKSTETIVVLKGVQISLNGSEYKSSVWPDIRSQGLARAMMWSRYNISIGKEIVSTMEVMPFLYGVSLSMGYDCSDYRSRVWIIEFPITEGTPYSLLFSLC